MPIPHGARGTPARVAPLLSFAAAAVLTALALASLPSLPFTAPGTPYDRSIPAAAADFGFLSAAAKVVPAGASFAAAALPRDSSAEVRLLQTAVALLPGRRLVSMTAAAAGQPVEYLIVAGVRPVLPAWDLVLDTPRGSVWKRRR